MARTIQSMEHLSVVWAKIKGYPWWPATTDLRHLEQGITLEESREKFVVYFIGETTHAEIPGCMLRHFKECFDKYAHVKSKKLVEAVNKAQSIEDEILSLKTAASIEAPNQQKSCTEDTKTEEGHCKEVELSTPIKLDCAMQQQPDASLEKTERRSVYREPKRASKHSKDRIPFRKFEEVTLEGRVVDLLNKLRQGKDTTTELNRLLNKASKIKPKDIMNKYVLSGLITISKLIELKNNICDVQLINRLRQIIDDIKLKAQESVECTDCVEDIRQDKQLKAEQIMRRNKIKVIRTIYKILKLKLNNNFSESKSIAVRLYDYWESNDLMCSSKVLTTIARMPVEVLRRDGIAVFKYIADELAIAL